MTIKEATVNDKDNLLPAQVRVCPVCKGERRRIELGKDVDITFWECEKCYGKGIVAVIYKDKFTGEQVEINLQEE